MYKKIVITKGIIEVTEYENLNVKGNGGRHDGEGQNRQENYRNRQRQRRNAIRQLVCTNFDSGSKFVTLTFDNAREFDIRDPLQCNTAFNLFTKRMRYRYPDFRYLAVIEFQDKNDRGAVHYHMICNLPYIPKPELAEIWGNGFVKVNAIDKVDNVGAYVIKYMTADMDDTRLQGIKAYNCSKGLNKPVEVKSWAVPDSATLAAYEALTDGKTPSYARTYESEKAGTITYSQYNMNRQ